VLTESNITELLSKENIEKIKKTNLNKDQLKNLMTEIRNVAKKHGYNIPKGIIGGTAKLISTPETTPTINNTPEPSDDKDLNLDKEEADRQKKQYLFNTPPFQGMVNWYDDIQTERNSKKPDQNKLKALNNNMNIYIKGEPYFKGMNAQDIIKLIGEYKALVGGPAEPVKSQGPASSKDIENIIKTKRGPEVEPETQNS
jgi:hypothetical protein